MAFLKLVPRYEGYKIAAKREKAKTIGKTAYKSSVQQVGSSILACFAVNYVP